MRVWQKRIGYVVSMGTTMLLVWFGKVDSSIWMPVCLGVTGMFIGGVAGERIISIIKNGK